MDDLILICFDFFYLGRHRGSINQEELEFEIQCFQIILCNFLGQPNEYKEIESRSSLIFIAVYKAE